MTILEGRISFDATLIGTILNSKDVYSKISFQRWVESPNLSDELKNIIVSSLIYIEKEGNDKSKHESAFPYTQAPDMGTLIGEALIHVWERVLGKQHNSIPLENTVVRV